MKGDYEYLYEGRFTGQRGFHCDGCVYLTPTEADQEADHLKTGRPRGHHRCTRYGFLLFHGAFHPHLLKPEGCAGGPYEAVVMK